MRNKNHILNFLAHLIGWGIIFTFPLLFTWKDRSSMAWERYQGYLFVPITFLIIFYINYFLLINKLLFRKQLIRFILANLLLFLLLGAALDMWRDFYFLHYVTETPPEQHAPPHLMFLLKDGMMMIFTAALAVAIRMTENWYLIEAEKKELEKAGTEAELQHLKSQLNPHFLFNTLNNIYSLIAINPQQAQYAVHNLSKLLRHVLYEDNQKLVTLDQELIFMKSYIELMGLRLPAQVDLQVELPQHGQDIQIAPLLFISLIENAFKHGTNPVAPSFIHICFRIQQQQELSCRIENSFFPKKENDRSGSGIGLDNLRKRLELLYPGKYKLYTTKEKENFIAQLTLIP